MGTLDFQNPIVAGTTLVRQAIKSPDFVAGVSGWIVRYDGSAEFNNLNIRGSGVFGNPTGQRVTISNTGIIQIYNTSNQLCAQLDSTGLMLYNPATGVLVTKISSAGLLVQDAATGGQVQTVLAAGKSVLSLQPPNVVGHTYGPAVILGNSMATADAWLQLDSPQIDGANTSTILIYGENTSLGVPDEIALDATNVRIGATSPQCIGRGPVCRAFATADSAAVTAETVVLTTGVFTFLDGRAYRVKWGGLVSTSNANGAAGFRVRKTNAAGQVLVFGGLAVPSAVANRTCNAYNEGYFSNNTGAPIVATIALTLQNFDGAANTATHKVGSGGAPTNRWMVVEDAGDTNAYDWGIPLV